MQKSLSILITVFIAALSFSGADSFGWIGTGHKVVALIAWEDLTPKTKAAVTTLLKEHPRYEKDLLLNAPTGETPDEQDRTAFAMAATWPDMIRSQTNPMKSFSHPTWHYIDIPVAEGVDAPTAPADQTAGPHNAVEALTQCAAELKDGKTTDIQKSIDLCWIEHLVGDIHQPLHAATLYSKDHPQGDKGGNDDILLRDPPYPDSRMNLHLLWDSLPGDFQSEDLCRYEARGLREDPKYSREKLKDLLAITDFMAWANESHKLAVEDVYLNGKLETGINHGSRARSDPAELIPGVPPGYMENAEHVAMHQVTLAGYRLADALNAIFDPQK